MTTHATSSLLRRGHMEWTVSASIIGWLVLLAAAWSYLTLQDFAAADPSPRSMVTQWPTDSRIDRGVSSRTLLLFLHPKCPCSRATLRELDHVLANVPDDSAGLIVVATVPPDASEDWLDTDTLRFARQLPNSELFFDHSGIEAARFGASVSGQLILFDNDGDREFAGGVTPSRGHEGGNPGADGLIALLRGESNSPYTFPAFGCQLCSPDDSISAPQMAANVANPVERQP